MRAANRGDARAYRNLLRLLAPILCGSAQHAFLRQGTSTEEHVPIDEFSASLVADRYRLPAGSAMKTDDLIETLVQDAASRPRLSPVRRVLGATLLGALAAATLFVFALGVRSDLSSAFETWRFAFKFVLALVCIACAWQTCLELARPEVRLTDVVAWIAVTPALLAVAVLYELAIIPPAHWYERATGLYASTCLSAIPLLSIVPLMALLIALRAGAPRSPATTGAVAGLLAGSLSAALYATHCPDDSPLFVALWYTLAVGLVTLAGGLAGHRVLRW